MHLKSSSAECEILRQISLPCVSTPADIFLVFRTLLNYLKCIIYEDRYRNGIVFYMECTLGIFSQTQAQKDFERL